jgi:hypothetical protein
MGLFEKLSRGFVHERVTFDDKLKLKHINCVSRQTQFTPIDQHKGPLSCAPGFLGKFKVTLKWI